MHLFCCCCCYTSASRIFFALKENNNNTTTNKKPLNISSWCREVFGRLYNENNKNVFLFITVYLTTSLLQF